MKLCVVSDKSQFVASTRLLDMVFSFSDAVVLTPENATLWAEGYLARHSKCGAISGIQVTNFSRLFNRLYPNKSVLSPDVFSMLIARSAQQNKLQAFAKSSKKYGFSKEAQKMLTLAEESGVNFALLDSGSTDALGQKLKDLSCIHSSVKSLMPSAMVDASSVSELLLKKAKQGYFKNKVVCFVGYDDIKSGTLPFIEEVLKSASCVYVSCREYDNSQTISYSLCDQFLKAAKNVNASVEFNRKDSLSPLASHIATNLFATQPKAKEVSGISVVANKNRREEVKFVVEKIETLVRQGARYKDFEIVVPAFDSYAPIIASSFSKHNLPVYIDNGKKIDGHALFVLVEKFIKLSCGRNKIANSVSLLKNVLLAQDINEISTYENFCDKYGLEFQDLKKPLAVGVDDVNFSVCQAVHKRAAQINNCLPKSSGTVNDYLLAIENFISQFSIEEQLVEFKNRQKSPEEKEITDRAILRLKEIINNARLSLGDVQVTASQFAEIWQSAVESTSLRIVPPMLDAVLVTDLATSKHKSVCFMFVLGATEGDFPITVLDNGILSDREIKEINSRYNVSLGPTTEHVNQLAKIKVQELFLLASEQLVISYPKFAGGEQKFLSSLVNTLTQICLFKGKPLQVENLDNLAPILFYKQQERRAQSEAGAKDVVAMLESRASGFMPIASLAELLGSLKEALENNNKKEKTQLSNVISVGSELFFPRKVTSISQIESYFSCPYMHFATYGLRLKEKEEASIKALDIGNFLHKCLEKVTKKFMNSEKSLTDAEFARVMKSVLAEVVKEEKYQAKVNSLQLQALKAEACRLCYAVLKGIERSGFKPVAAELRFGQSGQLPAVSLLGTDIKLEGKIDRMDKCGNLVRLIDYKTGQVNLGLENLYYGKKVQLFAYLLSVIEDGKCRPAGVFYLPIKSVFRKDSNILDAYKMQGYFSSGLDVAFELDHDLSLDNPKSQLVDMSLQVNKENRLLGKKVLKQQAHIMPEEELAQLAAYAKTLVSEAVKDISGGYIASRPLECGGSKPCDYCPFSCLCKIEDKVECVRREAEKITAEDIIGANSSGVNS